jgi:hypothetical protein
MSTLMEDRLGAALRARADQVQPEDLRPLDHAVPVTPLRRHKPLLLGLAAAACAAAIAVPFVVGTDKTTQPSPAPAGPSDPAEVVEVVLRADVDGDGAPDDVRLGYADGDSRYKVVVDLASGDKVVTGGETEQRPELFVGDDLDGNGTEEVMLRVADDPSVMPHVFTWMENEGLVRTTFPDQDVAGWVPTAKQNRWAVRQERLHTWEALGDEQNPLPQVAFWTWDLRDGRFVPGDMRTRCLPEGVDFPVVCDDDASTSPGTGAHGDLPALMPAVEETLTDQPWAYGGEFFGPGSKDYAQLQGDLGEEGGAVAEGQVELVVTVNGVEHRAPVPAGQSPELVPQTLTMHGDTPVLLVRQSGGDLSVTTVYAFRDGELVQIPVSGDVPLVSGVVDHDGELTEQRTWVTTGGQLFSALLLDHETGRHRLWHWDNLGETISPSDAGEMCIDWASGDYGRCR